MNSAGHGFSPPLPVFVARPPELGERNTAAASELRSVESCSRYLGQAQRVVSESLLVLLQLAGHHLARPEVEASQVHRVAQVAGQLGFTPELLPRGTGEEEGEGEEERERGDRLQIS